MLRITNLSKTYLSKKNVATHALNNANAEFLKGEIVAILGPSGSGKTTLLNLLSGFDKADAGGEIFIDGISTKAFNDDNWDNYRSYKVGYIFQDNCLIEHLTALDNVCTAIVFAGTETKMRVKLAKEALKKVGLEGFEDKFPNELSGGQQQLVAVARAIVKDPDIILADEPTGSLDSKASKQVLDVLKNVCDGKLLIIASHNEKLAKEYSTRIMNLEDGVLTEGETKQANSANKKKASNFVAVPAEENKSSSTIFFEKNKIKTKKSRLKFSTGIHAALSSLKYRKVKSLLMFAAGAVGVIVVSVILSFSNGLNTYIRDMQETTLAQYPITFTQSRDISKIESYTKAQAEKADKEKSEAQTKSEQREKAYQLARENDRVFLRNTIGAMLSTSGESTDSSSSSSTVNDLASLKKFLDTNPDNINDLVLDIEYAFRTSPVIFSSSINGAEEMFPANGLFGSLGGGSGKVSSSGSSSKQATTSANNIKSSMSAMGPLPRNEEVYRDDDCLVAGKWPSNPYELLMVLGEDGTIDDTMLYYLGMRDFASEIAPLIEKYQNNEKVDFPGQLDSYAYSDFLNKTLKMVNPSDCYKKEGNVWVDMAADSEYMAKVLENARDLKIVGVVLPKAGSRTSVYLKEGILFPYSLYEESIEQTKNSEIVQDQLNNPDIDVLSGVSFSYLEQAKGVANRIGSRKLVHFNLDMLLSSIKINPEALDFKDPKRKSEEMEITEKEMLEMMIAVISDPEFQEFLHDITKEGNFEYATYEACVKATKAYIEYQASGGTQQPEEWFWGDGKEVVDQIVAELPEAMRQDLLDFLNKYGAKFIESFIYEFSEEVLTFISDMFEALLDTSGPSFIEFDPAKFSKSMGINITKNDITQLMLYMVGATEHTYKGNLADFGYDDMEDPVGVTIYPKDYESKNKITGIIDEYNAEMIRTDQESKFATYNDDAASTVGAAQVVVSLVATLLIFFVSSIFISSTLLLGVVFGLSTISRRREVGILRALGARRRDVARVFNCETLLIGLFAGVLGVIVALLIDAVINMTSNASFDLCILPIGGAVILVVISVLLMVFAGFVPAKIASKKDPVKAIRGL